MTLDEIITHLRCLDYTLQRFPTDAFDEYLAALDEAIEQLERLRGLEK